MGERATQQNISSNNPRKSDQLEAGYITREKREKKGHSFLGAQIKNHREKRDKRKLTSDRNEVCMEKSSLLAREGDTRYSPALPHTEREYRRSTCASKSPGMDFRGGGFASMGPSQ